MTGVRRLLETGLILCGALAIFLLTSLITFSPADPGWSQSGHTQHIQNAAGAIGAWFADILLFALGALAYTIPFVVAGFGYVVFHRPRRLMSLDYLTLGLRLVGILLFLLGATGLASLNIEPVFAFSPGGLLGDVITGAMLPYFNLAGTSLILLTFVLTGITLVSGLSWIALIDKIGESAIVSVAWCWNKVRSGFSTHESERPEKSNSRTAGVAGLEAQSATQSAAQPASPQESKPNVFARIGGFFTSGKGKQQNTGASKSRTEQDGSESWDSLPLADARVDSLA